LPRWLLLPKTLGGGCGLLCSDCACSDSVPDLGPGICCIVRGSPPTPAPDSPKRGWGSARLAGGPGFFRLQNTGPNTSELGCRYGCRYWPGLLLPRGGLPGCASCLVLRFRPVPLHCSSGAALLGLWLWRVAATPDTETIQNRSDTDLVSGAVTLRAAATADAR